MTPEQKIIIIAEFEGWKNVHSIKYRGLLIIGIHDSIPENERNFPTKDANVWCAPVPPYLTSRDAICGAVARLDELHFRSFVVNLEVTTECRHWWNDMQEDDMRRILLATPAQLADALLLTLGHEI